MSDTATRRGIYGKLAGDTTLNNLLGVPAPGYVKAIYHSQAPAQAVHPFVIINKQSGMPTETMGLPSAMETDIWLVKAVDKSTGADVAEAIKARLVALLNDTTLSISGSTLLYLRRQSDEAYPEVIDGESYVHSGSLFRLVVT